MRITLVSSAFWNAGMKNVVHLNVVYSGTKNVVYRRCYEFEFIPNNSSISSNHALSAHVERIYWYLVDKKMWSAYIWIRSENKWENLVQPIHSRGPLRNVMISPLLAYRFSFLIHVQSCWKTNLCKSFKQSDGLLVAQFWLSILVFLCWSWQQSQCRFSIKRGSVYVRWQDFCHVNV